jgi:Asp-tRNA(Asn)/Glu-tRNA(Gln) amidotransferase A subunit family amidase
MGKPDVDPSSLDFATIAELNALLRSRQISCKELTQHFLDRLENFGPHYNALATIIGKPAIQRAPDIDDDLKRERFRSPIQGIPYAVKDLFSTRDCPTTWGAKPFEKQMIDEDAQVIVRLRRAGGVLIGKLAMIELAGGGDYSSAAASLQGPGLNPWNKNHWSGGSSSGSGIAVAAGLVPYALGSETSGSIICPAAYCGVTGLRPTYGLVSRKGAMPLSWTCDKIGVLAHTADDCGYVLERISGADSEDRGSARKSFYHNPQYARPFRDLKVGFNPVDFEQWVDPPSRPVYATALNITKSLGAEMIELTLPDFRYELIISTIIECECASIFEAFIRSDKIDALADPTQINGLKAALHHSAVDYLKAMRVRTQIQDAFRDLFVRVDVLVAPSMLNLPEVISQPLDEQKKARRPHPKQKGLAESLISSANLCGLPGLSVPCGFVNGLPIGLQFVGPAFSESTLLNFGREFQKLTDFHKQHPTVS